MMNDAHPFRRTHGQLREIYSQNLLNIKANQALFYPPGQ